MGLSAQEIQRIREEALADDVEVPPQAYEWTPEQAQEYFESGGTIIPTAPTPPAASGTSSALYEVLHTYVNMRSEPKLAGKFLGTKPLGSILEVDLERPDLGWVRLSERVKGSEAWLLVDGKLLGLGPLLKRLPSAPAQSPAVAPAGVSAMPASSSSSSVQATAEVEKLVAPVSYVVVHSMVYVRSAPSREAKSLGTKRKGDVVSATARCGDWVMLEGPGGEWMMVDGRAMRLGVLMELSLKKLPANTTWYVTRKEGCTLYKAPGEGPLHDLTGPALGSEVKVDAECGLWARLSEQSHWVEMDCFFAG
mmetsp:Transcript_22387/g.55679  ORF Transcript_22387/g.55679 Transcript_22387/m.55679 type:complete len:308 (-) Transcript_22387:250-1173(-)